MENQASSKSIILNNGLYLGITGVVASLILYATGQLIELQWVSNVVGFIAMIVFIVLGFKTFKNANGGFMSWGQGVKIGLGIVMISALITVTYTLLFTNVIAPEFQEQAMQVQQQKLIDSGYSQEQVEMSMEMGKKFQSPAIVAAFVLGFSAFIGFVVSAIIAAIMKKNEEETY